MARPNVAIVDTAAATCAASRRRWPSAPTSHVTSDPGRRRRGRQDGRARAGRVRRLHGAGSSGRRRAGRGGARRDRARASRILGICLGMQVLFEGSEEEPGARGSASSRPGRARSHVAAPLKVPHMGWNDVHRGPAAARAAARRRRRRVRSTSSTATTSRRARPGVRGARGRHGGRFCAAVARDNVFGDAVPPGEEPGGRASRFFAASFRVGGARDGVSPRSICSAARPCASSEGRRDSANGLLQTPGGAGRGVAAAAARPRLHVVDLDARVRGRAEQPRRLIEQHRRGQRHAGRGRRRASATLADCERLFALGVQLRRARHGRGAASPSSSRSACRRYPGRIIVAVDARDGEVAVEGWTAGDRRRRARARRSAPPRGARPPSSTPISRRDGMRVGPNVEATARARARASTCAVIASGGVGALDDLRPTRATPACLRGDRRQGDLRGRVHASRRRRRARRPERADARAADHPVPRRRRTAAS